MRGGVGNLTVTPLSTIVALARAGALDHAWHAFGAAGYDASEDDPAALTVKGRLLKDRALRASGEARRAFYLQSAEAYRRSAVLRPGTYALINAATLSLLSGRADQAAEIAREVLDHIARAPDEPETPYWRAATEAEALLLLGRTTEARAALESAVAAAPRAWEDHASTLRQFLAIHEAIGADPAWLDVLRGSRSLCYSGGGPVGEGASLEAFGREVEALLAAERVEFAYGGLAAGTDLVVAERLLEKGAELHAVLPSDAAAFAARFVDPFGAGWRRRYDDALASAESVELVRPLGGTPAPEQVALAREIALGAARLHADRLMVEPVHLAIGGCASTAPGVRTVRLDPPSEALASAGDGGGGATSPIALLALAVGDGGQADVESRLGQVRAGLDEAGGDPLIAPHLSGDVVLVGYEAPAPAAAAARRLRARLRADMPVRIGGHYGLIPCLRDPFAGTLRPTGAGAEIAEAVVGAIPVDTIGVTLDFAAVDSARGSGPGEASWIGELQARDGGSLIPLYALTSDGGS